MPVKFSDAFSPSFTVFIVRQQKKLENTVNHKFMNYYFSQIARNCKQRYEEEEGERLKNKWTMLDISPEDIAVIWKNQNGMCNYQYSDEIGG